MPPVGRQPRQPEPSAPEDPAAPRRNPDLVGHGEAERTLLDAWNSGRLPHAWLIGGPPGIGKATLAFRFARFVLTQGAADARDAGLFGAAAPPTSLRTDPAAPVFRRVSSAGHADLLTVERQRDEKRDRLKRDIAVDDVRKIAPFLHRTAAEGGWRVAVIDGADRMNASGLNAVLKILEEPPPGALLLLVSDNPGGMLPTIRSRCRKLTLAPLSEETVVDLLGRYRPELPEDARPALARLAEGSVGRAMALADAGGLDLYRQMVGLLSGLPRLDIPAAHAFADGLTRKQDDGLFETATELLVWWLARFARALARGVWPAEVVPGEVALMARLAGARGLDRWVEVWEKVQRLFARAESANLDRKQVVLNALLTLEAAAT
ncbi:DNA polymerase III subunit delta' [Azospirillum sp. RWY-5-1]|uniref:DNA polymerase III subunit delta n=1 Tax=Azospirillum oleiclasticum TaxID=2735135 RepID=A0ABX2T565_9PROT|nr:DNA polymerase III subunit delta' [Azospirillum oleiclasticum]NYZ12067.1 DNA polymerase III subunit delta' [Azospirillum oleiclasticum]NYZ19227.1 DNA polymerase III subunit delta' [Azospirillum oleiclasticum]